MLFFSKTKSHYTKVEHVIMRNMKVAKLPADAVHKTSKCLKYFPQVVLTLGTHCITWLRGGSSWCALCLWYPKKLLISSFLCADIPHCLCSFWHLRKIQNEDLHPRKKRRQQRLPHPDPDKGLHGSDRHDMNPRVQLTLAHINEHMHIWNKQFRILRRQHFFYLLNFHLLSQPHW